MLASGAVEPWTLLFSALGVAIFLEGLPYFISPRGVRRYTEQISRVSDRGLRVLGLMLMIVGLLLAYVTLH